MQVLQFGRPPHRTGHPGGGLLPLAEHEALQACLTSFYIEDVSVELF